MNSFKIHLIAVFLCALTVENLSAQQNLRVLTEKSPLTYAEASTSGGGEATTFVRRVLDHANLEYSIDFVPWKRSFHYAQQSPNVLIYPIARTKLREQNFIWVGNIIPANYYLFKLAKRADIELKSINEAKHLTIGVVNNHAHHEYLIGKGFSNFQTVNSSVQNLKKLLLGRIDLFPLSHGGLVPLCHQTKIDCSNIVPAIALEGFSDGLYMAFSQGSNASIVNKVKQSYRTQRTSAEYETLFKQRLIHQPIHQQQPTAPATPE